MVLLQSHISMTKFTLSLFLLPMLLFSAQNYTYYKEVEENDIFLSINGKLDKRNFDSVFYGL